MVSFLMSIGALGKSNLVRQTLSFSAKSPYHSSTADYYREVLVLYLERPATTVRGCMLSEEGASDTAT
jgi:hypothetical protein